MHVRNYIESLREDLKTHLNRINMYTNNLGKRFVSDYSLPIQVLDREYFEYLIDLYEDIFESKTKYNNLVSMIQTNFQSNPELCLGEYSNIRDEIIFKTEQNKAFIDFKDDKELVEKYTIYSTISSNNIYNETNVNKIFLSIDLKKANFQALRFYNPEIVFDAKTYEDFIGHFTDLEYIKKSKFTRQVIFGKMNPKRTIILEKYLMNNILTSTNELIFKIINENEVVSFCTDEIILELKNYDINMDCELLCNKLKDTIKIYYGIDVDVEIFILRGHKFKTHRNGNIMTYEKEFMIDKKSELMCVPSIYFAQIYKLLNGQALNEKDLTFYYEHQLAHFNYPLTLEL